MKDLSCGRRPGNRPVYLAGARFREGLPKKRRTQMLMDHAFDDHRNHWISSFEGFSGLVRICQDDPFLGSQAPPGMARHYGAVYVIFLAGGKEGAPLASPELTSNTKRTCQTYSNMQVN